MKDKLLDVTEVSDYLKVAKSTIYNYVKKKNIPTIKLNGRILFSQGQINSWIKSNSQDVNNKVKYEK